MLGIIKDYLAIARGTVVVTANAALAGGRSAVTALTTIRPSHLAGLRDRSSCSTQLADHNAKQEEQDHVVATIQGEVERILASLELGWTKELEAMRQRLVELERQFASQTRLGGAGDPDQADQ